MSQTIVQLQLGDLFESTADILVIPCSTAGTMSAPFRNGFAKLGISSLALPERKLGLLEDFTNEIPVLRNIPQRFLFAVSVDNQSSNYGAIEQISFSLALKTKEAGVNNIACPLLGTGAGGLAPQEVFRIIKETFERNASPESRLTIIIFEEPLFDQLGGRTQKKDTPEKEKYTSEKEKEKTLKKGITYYAVGAS